MHEFVNYLKRHASQQSAALVEQLENSEELQKSGSIKVALEVAAKSYREADRLFLAGVFREWLMAAMAKHAALEVADLRAARAGVLNGPMVGPFWEKFETLTASLTHRQKSALESILAMQAEPGASGESHSPPCKKLRVGEKDALGRKICAMSDKYIIYSASYD